MWNRITQAAGFSGATPEGEDSQETIAVSMKDVQDQLEQQHLEIEQLKVLLRENEDKSSEKEKQLTELSSKFQRFQIQSKAKITSLTNQLKDKAPKKDEGDFDDTSSSDSSDYSTRGKILLLRKQLETSKQQLEKKEKDNQDVVQRYETRVKDLELQLHERKDEPTLSTEDVPEQVSPSDRSPQHGSSVQEMYAQMVYKDSKILELNNHVLELERRILDLQEHVKEKDEVLASRNLAVQLMTADMSRKGKTVADELEETRDQMKLMQSNFADIEHRWKSENDALKSEMIHSRESLEKQISEKDSLIMSLESSLKQVESVRYELTTKNAELQKRIVIVEERADKQRDARCKKLEQELHGLQESLKDEKNRSTELQKALDEAGNQSDSKVFKARVKERTKLKALERELNELKNLQLKEQKTEEVTQLQQQVAILEEEKGTLQLRLIEVDEQISTQENLKAENNELQEALKETNKKVPFLEEQIQCLGDEKNKLSNQVEEQEKAFNELQSSHDEIQQQNLSLSQDLQELNLKKEDLSNHISMLEDRCRELKVRNEELSENVSCLQGDKVSLDMKIIELEEINENNEKQKDELLQKLKEMQDTFKDEHRLLDEKIALEAKCDELSRLLDSSDVSKENLLQQVESLKSVTSEKGARLSEVVEENSEIKNRVSELGVQLDEMKILCSEKDNQCISLTNAVGELRKSLDGLLAAGRSRSLPELQERWVEREEKLETYKRNIELSEKNQVELQDLIRRKEQEVVSLTEENSSLQDQVRRQDDSFKDEKNRLNETLKQETDAKKQLEDIVHEKDNFIGQLQGALEQNKDSIEKLNEGIQSHLHQLSQVQDERDLARKEVDELMKKLSLESEKTQSKISSLWEQVSDLESEVSRLNNDLSVSNKREKGLRDELLGVKREQENSAQERQQIEAFYRAACEEKDGVAISLQEKISTMNRDLLEKKDAIETLRKDMLERYEAEVETTTRLRKNVEDLQRKKQVVEGEHENLKQELLEKSKLNEAIQALEGQLATLREDFSQQRTNLEDNLSQVSQELNSSKEQISQLQETISVSQLTSGEIENLNQQLSEQKAQLEVENNTLKENLQTLNSELNIVSQEANDLKTRCTELSEQSNTLSTENNHLQIMQMEHDTLKMKFEELLQNSSKQKTECEKLLHDVYEAEEQYHSTKIFFESSLKSIQETLDCRDHELHLLNSKLEEAEKDKVNYCAANEQLEGVIEDTNNQLKQQETINNSLMERIKQGSQQSDVLVNELYTLKAQLEKDCRELKEQLNTLNQDRNTLFEENISLKGSIKTCEEVISKWPNVEEEKGIPIEDSLNKLAQKYGQFVEFEKACCKFVEQIPADGDESISPVEFTSSDSIVQYFENAGLRLAKLKNQLANYLLDTEKLTRELDQLTEGYAVLRIRHEDLELMCSSARYCLPKKISSIEESNVQQLQTMASKVESLYDTVGKLSSFKEEFQRHYLSYSKHEQLMKQQLENHQRDLELLKRSSDSERAGLTETINTMETAAEKMKHRIGAAEKELNASAELIRFLKSEADRFREDSERLNAIVQQNENNLTTKLGNSITTISMLKKEVAELKKIHKDLRKEHDNDLSSFSSVFSNLQNETEVLYSCLENMKRENTALQMSLSDDSSQFHKLQQQNSQLEGELDEAKHTLAANEDEKTQLLREQQLQIITHNEEMESLKLEVEKCTNEKQVIFSELENLRSFKKNYEDVNCKYTTLREFMETAGKILKGAVAIDNISNIPLASTCDKILDDDFMITVNLFRDELILATKEKEQLTSLKNKIVVLEEEIQRRKDGLSPGGESDFPVKSVKDETESVDRGGRCVEAATASSATTTAEESFHQSTGPSDSSDEVQSLKRQLTGSKATINRFLAKIKLYKTQFEKMRSEILDLKSFNQNLRAAVDDLEWKHASANEQYETVKANYSALSEEKKNEMSHAKSEIEKLREHNSFVESENNNLNAEVKKLKQVAEERATAISEHREDTKVLRLRLQEDKDIITALQDSYSDLQQNFDAVVVERLQLENKLKNLQEHADMVMSDNETYQSVVEKLNISNATLKNDAKKLNETYLLDVEHLKGQCELEIEKRLSFLKKALSESQLFKAELQHQYDQLQVNYDKVQEQLESTRMSFQVHLNENVRLKEELEHQKPDVSIHQGLDTSKLSTSSQTDVSTETEAHKPQVDQLNHELHLAHATIHQWCEAEERWKSDQRMMESHYQKIIAELQGKMTASDTNSSQNRIEMELQQALSSLHKKSIRCEELSVEFSKLLEERNLLKMKLSQFQQHHQLQFQQQEGRREDVALQRSSDIQLDSVKVEVPVESKDPHVQSEVAKLHQRLLEAEKTCQELRKANEALDSSLVAEREQRQMVEEELGYAQKQLMPAENPSKDEYHLLLEDFEEPEMFVEKNFSITREVKSHAYKFRRWLRGRRMFMHRSFQRKKYSEILYIFYICAVHLWLLLCLVKHS